ncbi:dehydrogenase/reductase SDR family member 4-like isoform X1 [Pomacea canaliculata]|uniref:dehydrogenase/reductase SDR family member 4-like isoform X1 n=2 Tax=Pomacea canaliculata TaxID=400727 RepID=UPI000D7392C8|nr:dehydrogenase/reductase SDR family member 4-like isoform X1 [Pomacea canaliculata]XP_025115902.1 dehydrogenase/reductase SDR family member 4-like isoform X1 [Pomacea canaliculata]
MLRQMFQGFRGANEMLPLIQTRLTSSKSSPRLAGKVAIVTASTEGIGLAIARRLAEDGAKVMISSRKQKNVDAALQSLRSQNLQVSGIVCHVSKEDDRAKLIEETVKQFGGIDILVSNAAANPAYGSLLDTSEDAWDKIFDTNVKATFLLCKEVVPHIEKRGAGVIIIVSSIGGYHPLSLIGAYSISKTALLGMTKALAPELAARNIRVNCIAPGIIQTRFSEALWKNDVASEIALQQIPLQRFGTPEDCGNVVSFLVSEEAKYITGETVVVAGGMSSRL